MAMEVLAEQRGTIAWWDGRRGFGMLQMHEQPDWIADGKLLPGDEEEARRADISGATVAAWECHRKA